MGKKWKKNRLGGKLNSCLRDVHVCLFLQQQLRGNLAQTGVVWEGAKGELCWTLRPLNATPGETVFQFGGEKRKQKKQHKKEPLICVGAKGKESGIETFFYFKSTEIKLKR